MNLSFSCPVCRSPVKKSAAAYACRACDRRFPILFGIPDFRLRGDRYLSLEDERNKAARLHEYGRSHDFGALVAYYYSITDDVPPHLEAKFAAYVLNAPARLAPALRALAPNGGRSLLDLGCGSGGALVAAAPSFRQRVGVDIALRWLVIARRRLEEAGVSAELVCADAEALPFSGELFSHILAGDLVENTRSPAAALKSAGSALAPGGRFYVSSSNSTWVGPHPATGIWGAGLIPASARTAMLRRRHGFDILRGVSFVSPLSVRRMARSAGLRQVDAGPLQPELGQYGSRSSLFRFFAKGYSVLAGVPILRTALLHAGPVFQAIFVKD